MIATPGELPIQHRLGLAAFRRALAYHRSGAIEATTRDGHTLRARCKGSQPTPYQVWATLDTQKVVVAHCSCPVGASGRCKHVGALLLAWKYQPAQFRVVSHVDPGAPVPRSSAAQVPVLEELAEVYPELGWLASRPAVRRGERTGAEVAQAAARRLLGTGPASYETLQRLHALRAAAERSLNEGERGRAAAVYEGLLRALLERAHELGEGQPLAAFSVRCAAELGRCLQGAAAGPLRGSIIRSLYFVVRAGAEGDLALGALATEALRRWLSPDERTRVIGWLSEAVAQAPDGERQRLGLLWMQLEAGRVDNERMLAIARASGRVDDAVDRLLRLGRVEAARTEAQRATPDEAVAVARRLADHGERKAAVQVLASVRPDERPVEVLDALTDYLDDAGETRRAYDWAMDALRREPTVERYRRTRMLGEKLGQGASLRLAIEAWLIGAGEEAMLASVYLDEGAYDEALSLAERSSSLETKEAVARASESARPRQAMNLYRQIVTEQVARHGREGYQQSRSQLRAMKRLHERLGDGPSWATLAARLRAGAPVLRAAG